MKDVIFEKLHRVQGSETKFVRESLYYSLGGYNYFTYQKEPRGYYLSVTPIERSTKGGVVMETYTAFTGTKTCVHEVQRKSAKAAKIAAEKAATVSEKMLCYVCAENKIEIEKECE